MKAKFIGVASAIAVLSIGLASTQARAAYFVVSGAATNYAVLDEGKSGAPVNFANSTITGNIGIGGTGSFLPSGGCASTGNICHIYGNVQFSAANTGQYHTNSGVSVSGGALFNQSIVQTTLNSLNTLSTQLGSESATNVAINIGNGASKTINASSGVLDGMGNRVFNITSLSFTTGSTLTIKQDTGLAGNSVVFNINQNAAFGGKIILNGLTADQVLFNVIGTNHTLTLSANGAALAGDFLDPNGTISAGNAVLTGRVFGGGTTDIAIASGMVINAPVATPLPGALVLFTTGLGAMVGLFGWRRKRKSAIAGAAA